MIIAILPKRNRTFAGVFHYNAQKSECLRYCNTFASNDKAFLEQIEFFASLNTRTKDPVFHAVLSLAPNEEVDQALLLDMIEEFMGEMGYSNQPFAVYEHCDKSHQHFHIVSSRIDIYSNKKINDSFEYKKANKITDSLIFKHGLTIVEGLHAAYGITNRINNTLTYILKRKPHSFTKLKELCQESGVLVKKTTERGYVFFVPGYRKGIPSSELEVLKNGRGLRSRMAANMRYRNAAKNELILHLEKTLNLIEKETITLKTFRITLAEQGVHFKLSRSETKINGMVFYYNGFEFKGSEVGSAYAWLNLSGRIAIPVIGSTTPTQLVKQKLRSRTLDQGELPRSPLIDNILRNLAKYNTQTEENRPKRKQDEEEVVESNDLPM